LPPPQDTLSGGLSATPRADLQEKQDSAVVELTDRERENAERSRSMREHVQSGAGLLAGGGGAGSSSFVSRMRRHSNEEDKDGGGGGGGGGAGGGLGVAGGRHGRHPTSTSTAPLGGAGSLPPRPNSRTPLPPRGAACSPCPGSPTGGGSAASKSHGKSRRASDASETASDDDHDGQQQQQQQQPAALLTAEQRQQQEQAVAGARKLGIDPSDPHTTIQKLLQLVEMLQVEKEQLAQKVQSGGGGGGGGGGKGGGGSSNEELEKVLRVPVWECGVCVCAGGGGEREREMDVCGV
jgi:hypothetical protein